MEREAALGTQFEADSVNPHHAAAQDGDPARVGPSPARASVAAAHQEPSADRTGKSSVPPKTVTVAFSGLGQIIGQ